MGKQKKEFKGVWIPKHILEDKDLSWAEIILYSEINSFEVCFKNNKTLAERLRLKNKESVSPMLSKLKLKGYIKEVGFDGRKKHWKAMLDQPKEKDYTSNKKILIPDIRKSLPIDNKLENKEKTNISNDILKSEFIYFWNLYDKKSGNKEKVFTKWKKLSLEDKKKIIDYIPQYIKSRPDKTFRKDPIRFLNNETWEDEIISPSTPKKEEYNFDNIRKL